MFAFVIATFLVCWLPYHSYFLYSYHNPQVYRGHRLQAIWGCFVIKLVIPNVCYGLPCEQWYFRCPLYENVLFDFHCISFLERLMPISVWPSSSPDYKISAQIMNESFQIMRSPHIKNIFMFFYWLAMVRSSYFKIIAL